MPFRHRVDLSGELRRLELDDRVAVPESVLRELESLAGRGVAHAAAARELAGRWPTLRSGGRGDDAIVEAARRRSAWVVTADRMLAGRLRRAGLTVVTPRDRARLTVQRALVRATVIKRARVARRRAPRGAAR